MKEKKNICIYCLKELNKKTKDHVLPKSWYINPDAPNMWTVPACEKCNNKYGKIENDLRLFLSIALNPTAKNEALIKKSLNSVNPKDGYNKHDAWHRKEKLLKVINSMKPANSVKTNFPNFCPQPGECLEDRVALRVPICIDYFCEKIIIGIEYKIENRYIDKQKCVLKINFCHDDEIGEVISCIKQYGEHFKPADGFEFKRVVSPITGAVLYEVILLEQLKFFGSIIFKDT